MWPLRNVVDSLSEGYLTAPTRPFDWDGVSIQRVEFEVVAPPKETPRTFYRPPPPRRRGLKKHQTPSERRIKAFRKKTYGAAETLAVTLENLKREQKWMARVKRGDKGPADKLRTRGKQRTLITLRSSSTPEPPPVPDPAASVTSANQVSVQDSELLASDGTSTLGVEETSRVRRAENGRSLFHHHADNLIRSIRNSKEKAHQTFSLSLQQSTRGTPGDGSKDSVQPSENDVASTESAYYDGPWESRDVGDGDEIPTTSVDKTDLLLTMPENPEDMDVNRSFNNSSLRTCPVDGDYKESNPEENQVYSLVGRTLMDAKVEQSIDNCKREWGRYATRIFQQNLKRQTRGLHARKSTLSRQQIRAKEWVKQYFRRGVEDLMDELIELKTASFVDPRKMNENIARTQKVVEVRRQKVKEGEERLRRLEQRYEIDMASARETLAFFEEKVEAALEKEQEAFDNIFNTKAEFDQLKSQMRVIETNVQKKEEALALAEERLQHVRRTLQRAQKKTDVVIDPALAANVQTAYKRWVDIKNVLHGVLLDVGCPFCFNVMRIPRTAQIKAASGSSDGVVTLCSHCLTEKRVLMTEAESHAPVLDHHRVANLVAQFGDVEYAKKQAALEANLQVLGQAVNFDTTHWFGKNTTGKLKATKMEIMSGETIPVPLGEERGATTYT